ncbi:unnamed protein product [Oppiella nova]|uniref:Major facilitator superfamily (MFS) profile domain-containing protein n=1 Tax=Oppiella nova TaxID=334625 RepID=A0A7R9LED8_9ACAR|nr:unnamed protein product [Oppiella nova]CAG2162836.1 unnamed protein product [Oppiella nova]
MVDLPVQSLLKGCYGRYWAVVLKVVTNIRRGLLGKPSFKIVRHIAKYYLNFHAPQLDYWCADNTTIHNTLHTKYSDNASDVCDTDCNHWEFDDSYGTTIIQEFQLVCDKSWLPSLSQSIYQSGYAVNGLILGYLSDRFGRRPVLWLAIILEICGGLSVIFSGSMTQYIISRFFLGLGDSGRGTQNTANVQKHRTILDLLSHRLMRNYTLIFWFSFAVNAFIYHGISLNVQQIGGNLYVNLYCPTD